MSGHSHFSTIKHKKAAADAKRGQIFSKLSRMISIAAKEKGGDSQTNAKLRMTIDEARSFNMPKDNIERAIKRGTGEVGGAALEEFLYEAYGPGKIAIIIEGITDNKNRALGEIKNILTKHGGKLAERGTVQWMFNKHGVLEINLKSQISNLKKDELELMAIEAGAEDINWQDAANDGERDTLEIYTKPEELEKVKQNLMGKGVKVESSSLDWVAKAQIEIIDENTKNQLYKLFEALDDNDDVQEIYSNLRA